MSAFGTDLFDGNEGLFLPGFDSFPLLDEDQFSFGTLHDAEFQSPSDGTLPLLSETKSTISSDTSWCPLHQSSIIPQDRKYSDFVRQLSQEQRMSLLRDGSSRSNAELYSRQKTVFDNRKQSSDRVAQLLIDNGCQCILRAGKNFAAANPQKRARSQTSTDTSQAGSTSSGSQRCQGNEGCTNQPGPGGSCVPCVRLKQNEDNLNSLQHSVQQITFERFPFSSNFDPKGQDIAYWHPCEDPDDPPKPGDIVGMLNGKVTKKTTSCQSFSVIPQAPMIIAGEEHPNKVPVAYIGQVNVSVDRLEPLPRDLPLVVLISGRNDGKGLLRLLEHISWDDVDRIVGDVVGFPPEDEVFNVRFLTVRIKVTIQARVWQPFLRELQGLHEKIVLMEGGMAKLNERVEEIGKRTSPPQTPVPPSSSSQVEVARPLPSPKDTLLKLLQKKFGGAPHIQIDSLQEDHRASEPRFGASKLSVLGEGNGRLLFEYHAHRPADFRYKTRKEAENAICELALQQYREDCSVASSSTSLTSPSVVPAAATMITSLQMQGLQEVTLNTISQFKVTLQNEAQRRFLITPKIRVAIQSSLDAPDHLPRFGASRLEILDQGERVLFACETPVPMVHSKKTAAENVSCQMALTKFLTQLDASPAASSSSHIAAPQGLQETTLNSDSQFKVTLQNEAQRKFLITPKIRVATQSSLDGPDGTALFGASRLEILDQGERMLFACETPVPMVHSKKAAAENVSCQMALTKFLTQLDGSTKIASLQGLQETISHFKVALQNEAQRKFLITPKIRVATQSTLDGPGGTALFGASRLEILDQDEKVLFACETPVPMVHSKKTAAENVSCQMALTKFLTQLDASPAASSSSHISAPAASSTMVSPALSKFLIPMSSSAKASLQNLAQQQHGVVVSIEVDWFESKIDVGSLFGASRCHIYHPDRRLLFHCETRVAALHKTKKAAMEASCAIALNEFAR